MHSGHYIAYVKSPNQMWFQMDDEEVSQVKQSTVLKQQAYLLFYRREGWEPPAAASRDEKDAEEQRVADQAVEMEAEAAALRKRRRVMQSSSDDESESEDSDAGETATAAGSDDDEDEQEDKVVVPKRVPMNSLPEDQSADVWHPTMATNLVLGGRRAAGLRKDRGIWEEKQRVKAAR